MPRKVNEQDPLKPIQFKLETSTVQAIRYIAWNGRRTVTAVFKIALEQYIKEWEAEHGPITPERLAEIESGK